MLYKFLPAIIFICSTIFYNATLFSQNNIASKNEKSVPGYSKKDLFGNDEIIHFKLIGRLNDLFNDRGNNSSYHPFLLECTGMDSSLVSIQLKIKTRGHFRLMRENCKMPPLLLSFPKGEKLKNSPFEKQGKLKLVVPCQGDEYVIREWLAYKLYNIISNESFRAKLVQVDFEDSARKKKMETHYCILLEDEKDLAERNRGVLLKRRMIDMHQTDPDEFKKMAVFQYMIGNTDWSVPYLQNIVLIRKDSTKPALPVPYDFDHAGIVDAPYAGPAPELNIPNVRVRLYRGFCENDIESFAKTFELYNQLKNDIYNLYANCSLLKSSYVKFVTRYFDDFYKTINSAKLIENEFQQPCRTNERVEIKGLRD